jgi:Ran GTPase-activating protein (RanGAP) involved in mRNA processing and transport
MELLNVVMPDLITGGEALGAMLEGNHTLKELDLRWNSLRLNSAVILAKSLRINDSLVTLKLGNNAFGELATETLGMSLKYNKTLTHLDLSYNSLNPKATSVIANSLMYNHVLKEIILDGNVLGRVGTQSLVASVQRAAGEHRTLEISFNNCDCEKVDKKIFDPANPAGVWKLGCPLPPFPPFPPPHTHTSNVHI